MLGVVQFGARPYRVRAKPHSADFVAANEGFLETGGIKRFVRLGEASVNSQGSGRRGATHAAPGMRFFGKKPWKGDRRAAPQAFPSLPEIALVVLDLVFRQQSNELFLK